MKESKIPILTGHSFRDKYFAAAQQSILPTPAFWINRRDDNNYQCQPHVAANRLDFYMVVLVTGGEGVKTFGTQEFYIRKGMLCFVPPGLITKWQAIDKVHYGYVMTFDHQLLPKLNSYPFFQPNGCPVMQLDELQEAYFYQYFHEIEREYQSDSEQKMDLIKAFLTIILKKTEQLYIYNERPTGGNAGVRLTAAFTAMLEKDFEKDLAGYAANLHVTPNYLSDTIKAVTGKTAGSHIRERLIKEASQLLMHTHLSIAEICYRVNFTDQSYFIRFFKKHTGVTPRQFRDGRRGNLPGV